MVVDYRRINRPEKYLRSLVQKGLPLILCPHPSLGAIVLASVFLARRRFARSGSGDESHRGSPIGAVRDDHTYGSFIV